jgi:hypothetical protein
MINTRKRRSQPVRAGLEQSGCLVGHREHTTGRCYARIRLAQQAGHTRMRSAPLDDRQREERIASLAVLCAGAHAQGDHDGAVAAWNDLRQLIFQRSPEQIARMEQRFMPARRAPGVRND